MFQSTTVTLERTHLLIRTKLLKSLERQIAYTDVKSLGITDILSPEICLELHLVLRGHRVVQVICGQPLPDLQALERAIAPRLRASC